MMKYQLHIQLAPGASYQPYAGWDHTYLTRREATDAKQRALRAGYHAVRVVSLETDSDEIPAPRND